MAGKGSEFEDVIEATFPAYAEAGIAKLALMPVAKTMSGIFTAKAPFDVYGWRLRGCEFVAAELKSSAREASMKVVLPKLEGGRLVAGKGDGLKFHQLDCLNSVAQSGGCARLVWRNDGEIGVLREQEIQDVYRVVWERLQAELRGIDTAPEGVKSIKWERFVPAPYRVVGGTAIFDWLEA